MKVLTKENFLELVIAELPVSLTHDTEDLKDLFDYYSEEIYHEWTNENIAEQAIKMVERHFSSSLSYLGDISLSCLADIKDYRDELNAFLLESDDFNIEMVGGKFAKDWDPKDTGVTWVTAEWAISEVHTINSLVEIVKEGIKELKANDDNVE